MNLLWASSFFSIRRSEEEENKHSKSYNHGDQDFEDLHRFVLLELITPDFKAAIIGPGPLPTDIPGLENEFTCRLFSIRMASAFSKNKCCPSEGMFLP